MRRIIAALLLCVSSAWAFAQSAKPLELALDAPDRHIVVQGDTLWGIASKFLKDPYRWAEIWRLNPDEVRNPHRIYPGQVVILDKSGDRPLLKLGKLVKVQPRVYVENEQKEIPAIPQNAIEPFLSQPLAVDAGGLDDSARIVGTQESRVFAGVGDTIYVTGAKTRDSQWHIFRPGKPMKNPDNPEEVLAHEAIFLGSARIVREGDPAGMVLTTAIQEIGRGDRLIPAPKSEIMSYIPRPPSKAIRGRVISLYRSLGEGGALSIVSLSRGKKDGVEMGHVLALYRTGIEVANRIDDSKEREVLKLPDERYGTLFVFRVFDRVSYGLVMNVSRPVLEGDAVQTP